MIRLRLRGRRGQMAIPSLFLLPSMILMVMLVIETARLSREKIRQQFALDASATLEMEQYTDLLNRMAYINGVFPHRIFRGGGLDSTDHGSGLYPYAQGKVDYEKQVWPIRFAAGRAYANVADPPTNFGLLHMNPEGAAGVSIEAANRAAFNYISVYRWLGDVAMAQKVVFENAILKNHDLLRKSLWMNVRREDAIIGCAGDDATLCGDEAVDALPDIDIRMHYVSGFKHCPVTMSIGGKTYTGELAGAFNFQGGGLFQLITVPEADLERLKGGFVLKNHWRPDPNYFEVDFQGWLNPYVRSKVNTQGGRVWPDTTPKYYTRLHP